MAGLKSTILLLSICRICSLCWEVILHYVSTHFVKAIVSNYLFKNVCIVKKKKKPERQRQSLPPRQRADSFSSQEISPLFFKSFCLFVCFFLKYISHISEII